MSPETVSTTRPIQSAQSTLVCFDPETGQYETFTLGNSFIERAIYEGDLDPSDIFSTIPA